MRLNESTKIIGKKVILIPYEAKHVVKYHAWMTNQDLRELTASEPLTLQQEYEMQQSWRKDDDKLTFLILSRTRYNETQDEIESLIGDTNLFLREEEEDSGKFHIAESEIMIAEPQCRGQGMGWEAMLLMLRYALHHLKIHKFEAKIGISNANSIKMFSKMQFKEVSKSEVFQEVTMVCLVTDDWISWLNQQVELDIEHYA